jgi:hypothetical protein
MDFQILALHSSQQRQQQQNNDVETIEIEKKSNSDSGWEGEI